MRVLASEKGNRVFLRQAPAENIVGGILIPESVSKKPQKGMVAAVSEFYLHPSKGIIAPIVKGGDNVLYQKGKGTEVTISGIEYIMLLEHDIYAII